MERITPLGKGIFFFILSLLIGLLWVGCADELPTGTSGDVIMPLKVANRWIGRETTFDDAGNVLTTRLDTLTILQMTNRNGEVWYKASDENFYINRGDGLYTLGNCTGLCAAYPAHPLDTFSTLPPVQVLLPTSSDPVEQIVASKVFAIDASITVPAGAFVCYHYAPVLISPENAQFIQEEHRFYAPNIGPVRIDTYNGSLATAGHLVKQWELIAVSL